MRLLKYIVAFILLAYSSFVTYLYFYKEKNKDLDKSVVINKDIKHEVKKDQVGSKDLQKKSQEKKKDKNSSKIVKKIPKDAIVIELPKVPKVEAKVPKVVTIGGGEIKEEVHHRLSTAMPVIKEPKKDSSNEDNKSQKVDKLSLVGLESSGRISTYLRAKLLDKKMLLDDMKKGGFVNISDFYLDNKKELEVLVFTHDKLKSLAKSSPFLSNIRVLIDKKNNQTTITNPYYFAKAFMGKNFDEKVAKEILQSITSNIKDLKTSADKLKSTLLPKYHFMFGMPYYKDMIKVASGDYKSLLSKVKSKKGRVAFIQELGGDKALVGIRLSSSTRSFIKAVGEKNALLLPYPVMIKKDGAYILDPKYYIAVSYPLLKMSQFMKISDIPDAIAHEAESIFR